MKTIITAIITCDDPKIHESLIHSAKIMLLPHDYKWETEITVERVKENE